MKQVYPFCYCISVLFDQSGSGYQFSPNLTGQRYTYSSHIQELGNHFACMKSSGHCTDQTISLKICMYLCNFSRTACMKDRTGNI